MKIKLFESFKTEDYYTKIFASEYVKLLQGNIEVEYEEFDQLIKFLDTKKANLQLFRTSIRIDGYLTSNEFDYFEINCFKLPDEWWLLKMDKDDIRTKRGKSNAIVTYYKCDQFEGLLKFLEDLTK